jgi:hypothetical protein
MTDEGKREMLFHEYNALIKLLKEIEKERKVVTDKIMRIRKKLFGRI